MDNKKEKQDPNNKLGKTTDINYIRNKISFFLIGFFAGLSVLSDLGIKYYIKNNLALTPTTFIKIQSFFKIPYLIKPLFGIIIDFLPLFGYKNKSYLLLCSIMNILVWQIFMYSFNNYNQNTILSIICLLLINIFLSFTTVIGQSILVGITRCGAYKKNNFNLNSSDLMTKYFFIKNLGWLTSSFMGGFLIDLFSVKFVFIICSFLPSLPLISSCILYEQNINKNNDKNTVDNENKDNNKKNNYKKRKKIGRSDINLKKKDYSFLNMNSSVSSGEIIYQSTPDSYFESLIVVGKKKKSVQESQNEENYKTIAGLFLFKREKLNEEVNKNNQPNIKEIFFNKNIMTLLIVILLLECPPEISNILFFYETNILKISPKNYGIIDLITVIANIICIFLFNKFFYKSNFRKIIIFSRVFILFIFFIRYLLISGVTQKFISNPILLAFIIPSISGLTYLSMLSYSFFILIFSPTHLGGTTQSFTNFSIYLGKIISDYLGNSLMNYYQVSGYEFQNLGDLVITSNFLGILPLLVFYFLPDKIFKKDKLELKKICSFEFSTSLSDYIDRENKQKKLELKSSFFDE